MCCRFVWCLASFLSLICLVQWAIKKTNKLDNEVSESVDGSLTKWKERKNFFEIYNENEMKITKIPRSFFFFFVIKQKASAILKKTKVFLWVFNVVICDIKYFYRFYFCDSCKFLILKISAFITLLKCLLNWILLK